jgi:hypothetical protein
MFCNKYLVFLLWGLTSVVGLVGVAVNLLFVLLMAVGIGLRSMSVSYVAVWFY